MLRLQVVRRSMQQLTMGPWCRISKSSDPMWRIADNLPETSMPNNSGKYFGNGPLNTEIQKWPCIHKAELWQWQWPNRITCTELPSLSALHICCKRTMDFRPYWSKPPFVSWTYCANLGACIHRSMDLLTDQILGIMDIWSYLILGLIIISRLNLQSNVVNKSRMS